MSFFRFAAGLVLSSTLALGCSAATDGDHEDANAEALRADLYGKWEGSGKITRIDFTHDYAETLGGFTKGKRFTATIDTGIRCITTPCNSSVDVDGVYTTHTGSGLTLLSFDKPSHEFAVILGDYRYDATASKLKLTKKDGSLTESFHHASTGVHCGQTVCGEGLYCCNPVMSICAKPGMFCIQ